MAKRVKVYEETYNKGMTAVKEQVIDLINSEKSEVFAINAGKYSDNRQYLTVKIEVDR
jgi:hypothetical protein